MNWKLSLESVVGSIAQAEDSGRPLPANFQALTLAVIAERLDSIAHSLDYISDNLRQVGRGD